MEERPIIFSGEMVKAILDDRKTQTRRVINPQPKECPYCDNTGSYSGSSSEMGSNGEQVEVEEQVQCQWCFEVKESIFNALQRCPYGKIGDRLWVREKHQLSMGDYAPTLEEELSKRPHVLYYASDFPKYRDRDKWQPAENMIREHSRITLEITNIRVERLQKITYEDILKEGWNVQNSKPNTDRTAGEDARDWFKNTIWNSIHKKADYKWGKNPWVWVISFRRVIC